MKHKPEENFEGEVIEAERLKEGGDEVKTSNNLDEDNTIHGGTFEFAVDTAMKVHPM